MLLGVSMGGKSRAVCACVMRRWLLLSGCCSPPTRDFANHMPDANVLEKQRYQYQIEPAGIYKGSFLMLACFGVRLTSFFSIC